MSLHLREPLQWRHLKEWILASVMNSGMFFAEFSLLADTGPAGARLAADESLVRLAGSVPLDCRLPERPVEN